MDTIISLVKQRIEAHPDKTVLRYKKDRKFKSVSWHELGDTVRLLGYALLEMGIKIGDRIAILSENRPEWVYADLAILSCGAVTVPIYATDTTKDIEHILKDSGAEIIFVSAKERLERVVSIAHQTHLRRIISFQEAPSIDPLVTVFDNFLSRGRERLHLYKDVLEQRTKAVTPDNPVTIIYTSGSTGLPKGAVLTNNNFISNCRSSAQVIEIDHTDRYLSFLPLSHVFERMAGYYMLLLCGAEIAYAESRDTIIEDAKALSPTLMYGVPRFFEKLYAEVLNKVIGGLPLKKNIFFWGYRVGRACMYRRLKKKRIPLYLAVQRFLVTALVARGLKRSFGGNLRFFVSGGAPLPKEIAYFFLSFDILILEGYGLTESSPVISVNTMNDYKMGTVGKPIPGVTVKIAPDGEILVKGPNIMKGYYRLYDDADSSLKDGWLYTGDIGHFDKDGFLIITDRKKDIIVTSGGKNIAPSEIETLIKADRYIEDILIYGEKKKFLSALIIPDFKGLEKYARFKDIRYGDLKELVRDERIRDFIKRRMDSKQKEIPQYAQVKRFIILDEELKQNRGELTPTLKIRRRVVTDKYRETLDSLYEEDIR